MSDKHIKKMSLASLYNHQQDQMGNVLFRKKDDHGGDGFYEGQDCSRSTQLSHEASYLEHSQQFIRMRREIAVNIFGCVLERTETEYFDFQNVLSRT